MGFWLQVKNLIFLEPGWFKGIRELSWDLLECLIDAYLVLALVEKELLEFECTNLQIRQFCVNEDPPDPMWAGA